MFYLLKGDYMCTGIRARMRENRIDKNMSNGNWACAVAVAGCESRSLFFNQDLGYVDNMLCSAI